MGGMQAKVESLRKKADATGWSAEMEQASEETLHRAKDTVVRCAVHMYVFMLSFTRRLLINNSLTE